MITSIDKSMSSSSELLSAFMVLCRTPIPLKKAKAIKIPLQTHSEVLMQQEAFWVITSSPHTLSFDQVLLISFWFHVLMDNLMKIGRKFSEIFDKRHQCILFIFAQKPGTWWSESHFFSVGFFYTVDVENFKVTIKR